MHNARILFLLPLLLLSEQTVSKLVFAFALLGPFRNGKASLTTCDVRFKNIRCNVFFLLCFAQSSELRQELRLFLAVGPRDGSRAKGAAEIRGWFGRRLGLRRDAWF